MPRPCVVTSHGRILESTGHRRERCVEACKHPKDRTQRSSIVGVALVTIFEEIARLGAAELGGEDYLSRLARARALYSELRQDVLQGLRSQADAEFTAVQSVARHGYDYECCRRRVLEA